MARNKFDVDEKLESSFDKKKLLRLLSYTKPYKNTLIVVMLLMLLSSVLSLIGPMCMKVVVDDFIPDKNVKALLYTSLALVLINLFGAWITRYRTLTVNRVGQSMIQKIRLDLFTHMQDLPFTYFDNRPHGKILSRVINYVNALSDLLTNGLVDVFVQLFSLIVVIIYMLFLNVQFTLVCLAGMPIFLVVLTVLKKWHRSAWQTYSAKTSNLNAYIHESIEGVRVTQSSVREDKNLGIFYGLCRDSRRSMMQAQAIGLCISNTVEFISVLTIAFVYTLGVYQITNQTLKVGALIAFTGYISYFWNPVTYLANFYNSLITAFAYAERIMEMMEEPVVVENLPGAIRLPRVRGEVEYQNVTFRYEEGERNILENTSFHVEPGQKIALVGPTGAGKTTVINLLARFYDIQGGKILIDGHDIKHVTLKSLRSQMGIMLQDTFLFTGTVMENIRYSRPNASDADVVKAAKAVSAHEFITALPDGYNTFVTERGSALSAGQRQLISFARTILADPAILILDEATSAIDTETERVLQKSVEVLMEGRTSFVIAHRLSTIKNSDKILYVADGGIAESGTHDELMAKKGKYYELYTSQYKFVEQDEMTNKK